MPGWVATIVGLVLAGVIVGGGTELTLRWIAKTYGRRH